MQKVDVVVILTISWHQSIHATALATFAETVGGLAALSTLKKQDKANLRNLSIEVRLI
jgi:acyl-coenzyme A thioesterase PaaI-like protein